MVEVDRRDLRSRRNSLDRGRAWKISERVNREGALRTPDRVGRHAHDNMPLQGDMAIAHPIDRWSLDWDWDGEGLKFQWIDVGKEMQEQGEALVEEKEVQLEVEDLREQCRIVCTELVDRERHAHESDHQKQKNVQKQDVSRVNTQHVDPQKEKRRPATTQEARPRAASALAKRSCSTASSASKRSHVNKTDTRSSYVSNEVQRVLATLDQVEKSSHLDRDWQAQMDALGSCRRLLVYKKETLVNQLHRIVVCTLPSVNSLRSNIAKQALTLFMEMFRSIPAEMNRELELVAPILLQKASDTSFLGQAADEAIKEMIDNCDEMQALNSLLKSATQRSSSVRLKVASHLEYYIVKKGLGTLLEQPAMLKAMFLVIAGMMGEGNQYTRTMAKRSLWFIFEILGSSNMWEELILSIPNVSHSNEVKRFFNSTSGPPEVTALSLALGRKKSLLHTTTKRARQKSSKQQLWKAG